MSILSNIVNIPGRLCPEAGVEMTTTDRRLTEPLRSVTYVFGGLLLAFTVIAAMCELAPNHRGR
jgi:hypothetical protein